MAKKKGTEGSISGPGSSKKNPIVDPIVHKTADSAAVTDLKITRSGNKLTASWKNATTYAMIRWKYRRYYGGKWQAWSTIQQVADIKDGTTTKNATSKAFTVTMTGYTTLANVQVGIEVRQATKAVDKSYKKKKKFHLQTTITEYNPVWEFATFPISKPNTPVWGTVTAGASSTTFNFSVKDAGATAKTVFNKVQYQKGHATNWGTKAASTFTNWGSLLESTAASGSTSEPTGASTPSGTNSITSMVRMRAVGPAGTTAWAYKQHVYARPYAAKNVKIKSLSNYSTGMNVTVTWTKQSDSQHPSSQHKVQYYIGTPAGSSLTPPASISWEDGEEYTGDQPGTSQQSTFYVDKRVGAEECIWVRVWQLHELTLETVSASAVSTGGGLTPAAPTINEPEYNAATDRLTLDVVNNSELPGAKVVTQVVKVSTGKVLWTLTGESPTVTTDLGYTNVQLRSHTEFGGYSSAVVKYTFNPTVICSNPTEYYPTSVRAVAGSQAGTARVTWVNVMSQVTEAEITVATSATEWSKANPDFVETATVQGNNPTSATIGNLETGVTYFFKVTTSNTAGETGYSATTGSCRLTASVVTPNLSLSEDKSHNIVVTWGWTTWSQTQRIELEWDDEDQKGDTNKDAEGEATIERNNKGGNGTYTIKGLKRGKRWYVWARYGSDTAWSGKTRASIMLAVTPVNPTNITFVRSKQATDEEGKTTAQLSWSCSWADADTTEVSWSDNKNAWRSTSGPETAELKGKPSKVLIPELDLGKIWYATVKLFYDDEFETADLTPVSLDLRTKPARPKLSLSRYDVERSGRVDLTWTYDNEDLSEQSSAQVLIKNSSGTTVAKLSAGSDQSIALYPETLKLAGNADYKVTVSVTSANKITSDVSEASTFHVSLRPTASITSTSLVSRTIGETGSEYTVDALTEMPLTFTIGGASNGGSVVAYIERANAVMLARPDETTQHGYEGELIATLEGGSNGEITVTMDDLRTPFEDMGDYRIVAYVINQNGKSDPVTQEFTCLWDHQAEIGDVAVGADYDYYIKMITPMAPEGAEEGDTFDIYRLSADKPEIIVRGGTYGTTYVDPYPALGENGGHRVVFRTAEGDYTTADGTLAWVDVNDQNSHARVDKGAFQLEEEPYKYEFEYPLDELIKVIVAGQDITADTQYYELGTTEGLIDNITFNHLEDGELNPLLGFYVVYKGIDTNNDFLEDDCTIINFDSHEISILYNMEVSHEWAKDFTETKYLGGAVQGDWNPAVSRTGSVGTVMLSSSNDEEIDLMRRLATYPGICHVRTPDGSSFAADVQVSEQRSYDTGGEIVKFSVSITRVDAESLDGMTLEEWEEINGLD